MVPTPLHILAEPEHHLLPPSPAPPKLLTHPTGKKIRDRLEYNNLVRTAKKCFNLPVENRVRILHADAFVKHPLTKTNTDHLDHLDIDTPQACLNQNIPLSHRTADQFSNTYGAFKRTQNTTGLLPNRFDYYNKTVGNYIRQQKEQNKEIAKLGQVGKFLRGKRQTDILPRLEAKFAYDDSDSDQECSDFEDIEEITAVPLKFEKSEIDTSGNLEWLERAQKGPLISRPIEKKRRGIKEWDDLSKVLIRKENLDFNTEKGKKYRGQTIAPKVNSWLTQQEYESIVSQTGKPCRLLFPSRNADWTLQKKLYQGKDEHHNAVFQAMSGNKPRKNYGYDNDLLYWPTNHRGYMTKGNIEQDQKFYY